MKQDEIEDVQGRSPEQIINDPAWGDVRKILLEFSRTLSIPDSYADETTNYYRYHGVRDSRYLAHCLESENIFMTEAIGNNYWSKILGSILILLTECHDKHDMIGLETGIEFATKYYEIVLQAKASQPQKTPSITA